MDGGRGGQLNNLEDGFGRLADVEVWFHFTPTMNPKRNTRMASSLHETPYILSHLTPYLLPPSPSYTLNPTPQSTQPSNSLNPTTHYILERKCGISEPAMPLTLDT